MCQSHCNKCNTCKTECSCQTVTYDPCAKDYKCKQKIDAECVIYNMGDINGLSRLTNLNLPNGINLKQFMEAVDAAIGCL